MSAPTTRPALSWVSLASLLLGLLALVGGAFAGIPALILGLAGLRAVHAAEGQLRGRRLAIAGMALGGAGTALTLCGLLAILILHLHALSQRVGCQNNLRLIGEALQRHHDQHGHFPPASIPHPEFPPGRRLSWLTALLPLLDENPRQSTRWADLAAEVDRSRAWDAPENARAANTHLPPLLCPGDRREEVRTSPLTSFVGLAGVGEGAASLARSDPAAGVFGYDRGVSREEARGGISTTLMAAETIRPGRWAAGGTATVRGVPRRGPALDLPVHRGDSIGSPPFGAFHPAGVHVLWMDGSARIIRPDIDPPAFRAHALLHREAP